MRIPARILMLLLLPALPACLDSKLTEPDPVHPPEIGVFPDTPDRLMQNVQATYEAMNLLALQHTLGPDHVTILQQSTQTRFPGVGSTLDRDQELRAHERLFSRQAVVDPLGNLVPAILSVQFQTFVRQSAWAPSPAWDPIPGTMCALYDVVVLWDRGRSLSTIKTQGQIRFYVTERDSVVAGVTKPYYELRGQTDLTLEEPGPPPPGKAATETTAWGTVKALFP